MYIECDESSLYSRINYVHPHGPQAGLYMRGDKIIKRCTQGLARTRDTIYANAPVLTRKKPDVMI